MTAHCSRPASCSVCLQTPARRVEIINGATLVDGIPSGGGTTAAQMPQPRGQKHRYGRRRK